MTFGPISMSRRHVLGDLYSRCDAIDSVPVFIEGDEADVIGHADEGLGHYADAFCFHLAEDICKKLSQGQFTYSFEYELSEGKELAKSRVRLLKIILNPRKGYAKPVSRSKSTEQTPLSDVGEH